MIKYIYVNDINDHYMQISRLIYYILKKYGNARGERGFSRVYDPVGIEVLKVAYMLLHNFPSSGENLV